MPKFNRVQQARLDKHRTAEEAPEFQVAPMIDILLVLLVFFLSISATEMMQADYSIQLPEVRNVDSVVGSNTQTIININWEPVTEIGSLMMNNELYQRPEELMPAIQRLLLQNSSMRVVVRAHRNTRYAYLKELMEALGRAGVTNVTFSVIDQQPAAAPTGN